jgi:PAT family beta-lactamase induction signal transducer AmpG
MSKPATPRPKFVDTLKALKNKNMFFLLLMGVASGLPFALTLGTLQAWMKDASIDLKTIGLFAFLRLPFSLKFLWAPLMDRYTFPFLDRRRGWAVITQVAMAACIGGMALTNPATQIQQLVVLTLLLNFLSASQDIVLDAYRRELLPDQELGLGVSVFVNGYIVSMRYISGALALFLAGSTMGWSYQSVYGLMALFMVALVFATLAAPKLTTEFAAPATLQEAFFSPLKEYFSRPGALTILAFIVLYKVGDSMAGTMTLPFVKELGFTNDQYVAIVKVWGPVMTFVGTFIGGHIVYQIGIIRSLWIMGVFQALSTAAFATLVWTGTNAVAFAAVVAFENVTAQMGTAAYASYMGSVTNRKFTATQYALLSSLMAVPMAIFGSRTGELARSLGWAGFFSSCALIALPGMFLIPLLQNDATKGLKNILRVGIISLTVLGIVYATATSTWDILKMFKVDELLGLVK